MDGARSRSHPKSARAIWVQAVTPEWPASPEQWPAAQESLQRVAGPGLPELLPLLEQQACPAQQDGACFAAWDERRALPFRDGSEVQEAGR